ncbi:MAG TPA: hypothetical protein DDZ80_12285 [Cyanobacteria bacterium UBA8803]|nr:hypothetical protein [Cyanobacteria bacterium UBA9273]HBL59258.1 hypothetical protein [Cyanobacteria bacterium UBA8803]
MKKIDLVFRTVGERTSQAALDLAIKQIQPDRVHIIDNVKPFSQAVQQMIGIDYEADFVVAIDADCLILEDMVPFLQNNTLPYVDCYVLDKFRGQIHCGVHITRVDVIRAMQKIKIPQDDSKYVLRPESRLRGEALRKLNLGKAFQKFQIFHDFFQFYRDIFAKYALRELRSRTEYHQAKLNLDRQDWQMQQDDLDFQVAHYAVEYAREEIANNTSPQDMAKFIEDLPNIAIRELEKRNIPEKAPFNLQEAWDAAALLNGHQRPRSKKMKVFGIGLNRTGTTSLTMALNRLGINVIHYPDEQTTEKELMAGNYDLSLLNNFDGTTAVTNALFFAQLDRMYPDSKFILTVRDQESWLNSIAAHWHQQPVLDEPGQEAKMQRLMLLRVAVFGIYKFNRERLSYVYDLHYKNVMEYFKDRPESLLVINICAGERWEKLCPFFNLPVLDEPFPWKNSNP